jgi:RNA polymerase-binding protein DksA
MAQRGGGLADAARRAVGRAAKAVRGKDAEAPGDGRAGTRTSGTAGPAKKTPGKKTSPAKKAAATKSAAPAKKATSAGKATSAKAAGSKKSAPAKKATESAARKPAAAGKATPAKTTTKSATKSAAPSKRTGRSTTKDTQETGLTKKATTTNARAKTATAKTATAKTAAQPTAQPHGKPTTKAGQRRKPTAASLQVGSNEEPWSEAELAAVRSELEHDLQTMLSELTLSDEQIAELIQDASNASGDDPADTGSKAFEREHEMTLANNTRDLIRQTRRALGRIAAGSYGTCESCGNAIGKRRLQAFPRATLCVTCKQEQERR